MGSLSVVYNYNFIMNYTINKAKVCCKARKALKLYKLTNSTIACITYYEQNTVLLN